VHAHEPGDGCRADGGPGRVGAVRSVPRDG
jgi:hypothetical protein